LPEHTVIWVKRATARFRRPARTTVWADCLLTAERVDQVVHDLVTLGRSEPEFTVVWRDQSGTVYCEIGFTIFAATAEYMRARHPRQENQ
jgi:predicted N-acetyltransferase YhbS